VFASRLVLRGGGLLALLTILFVLPLNVPTGPMRAGFTYVQRAPFGDNAHLYAYDAAYGVTVPLASSETIWAYDWSSDGAWLAYLTAEAPGTENTLVVRGPRGVTYTYATVGPRLASKVHWLPGDERVLYFGGNNIIHMVDFRTGATETVNVPNLQFIEPRSLVQLAPGHLLVRGQGIQAPGISYFEIFTDSGLAVSADDLPCSNDFPRDLVQSPDGSRWLFRCDNSGSLFISPPAQPEQHAPLVAMESDGVPMAQMFPRWSPDGTRVMFLYALAQYASLEPPGNLYTVPAVGGEPTRLNPPSDADLIDWLPPEVFRAR